jgi:cell wall-associated NlpC family hydrolase
MTNVSAARSAPAQSLAQEDCQRRAVVAEARKWIGTPYHDGADIRGAGVDCGMLIVRVFVDLGLVPPFDPRPYPPDWMIHRSDEKYLRWLDETCGEVETPRPGDIAIFRYGRCYGHGGIITAAEPRTLIHSYADARQVIEEGFGQNQELTKSGRKTRFFSIWAKKGAS